MGWKAACIVATTTDKPLLSKIAHHDHELADQVATQIAPSYLFHRQSSFEDGCYPQNGNLYVGAYHHSIVIGDIALTNSCFEEKAPPIISQLNQLLPNCCCVALLLHSVVNLYGYAVFHNGKPVRIRAGCADDGEYLNFGVPIAEELPLDAKASTTPTGERIWTVDIQGTPEEFDHSSIGEEYVFAISKRFFGEQFDQFDHDQLTMSEYKLQKKSFLSRLMGK
ncbi:MAG: hypothetical protein R3B84_19625 [Zavarzinella sp.]